MAVAPESTSQYRTCPQCDEELVFSDGFWQCTTCSHVPCQGAD